MPPRCTATAPPDLGIASNGVAVATEFEVLAGSSSRTLVVRLGGVEIASWSAGGLSTTAPYAVQVSNVANRVAVRVDRAGGWPQGAYNWAIDYADSSGSVSASGRFAVVTVTPAVLAPAPNQSGVSRRPSIYASYNVSGGTPYGVDLQIDGSQAERPDFEHTAGGSGTLVYGSARHRRSFRWGARVSVVARPGVKYGDDVFRTAYEYSWTVAEKPASRALSETGMSPLRDPVAEALRQLGAHHLRPRPSSPPLSTVLRRLLQRSTVGQLAPVDVRRDIVPLYPEDDPGDTALKAFIREAAPLWGSLLAVYGPAEEQDALATAWASRHPVEQTGALALLLFYAIEGYDAV